ncbi:MAG: tetratricopeptide repeat protein [Thermoflexaceae bacterium]|nr:tetratricopeptide repeat protein [Thermoflexaceae bacterium]
MRCYQCNSPLTDEDFCVKCGADVTVYKMVAKTSNSYYNLGLAKAQVRDLTGAVNCLKTSLRLNKNNIKARNLLGLVYFEMGEIVEALTQWVISRNLKPEKNAASVYIRKIQSNQNKFEAMNQTIKKFNQALKHAKTQNYDLAVIQLKKILATNPRMIKALQLLALLLMKDGDYGRAKKYLRQSLKIDKNNTISQKYLYEIELQEYELSKEQTDTFLPKKKKTVVDNKPLSGNDVIVPPTTYKEPSNGAITVINILVGVLIGAAIIWFLIMPARLQSQMQEYNKTLTDYSEQLSNSNGEITSLKTQVDKLTAENEELKSAAENVGITVDNVSIYDAIISGAYAYMSDDKVAAAEAVAGIDMTQVTAPEAVNIYNTIKSQCFEEAAASLYEQGFEFYGDNEYTNAVAYLERSLKLNEDRVEAVYYLAMSYQALKENDKAKTYYQMIVDEFPDSFYANDAKAYLKNN